MIALLLALLCGTANALEVKAPSPNVGTITPTAIAAETGSFSGSVTASSFTASGSGGYAGKFIGNVAVGQNTTTDASTAFQVNGLSSAGNGVQMELYTQSGGAFVGHYTDGATYNLGVGADTQGDFIVVPGRTSGAAGTEAMRVKNSNGFVGIGTASPCSTCTLHVAGGASVTGKLSAHGNVGLGIEADGTYSFRQKATTDVGLVIHHDGAGNLRMGASSDASVWDVNMEIRNTKTTFSTGNVEITDGSLTVAGSTFTVATTGIVSAPSNPYVRAPVGAAVLTNTVSTKLYFGTPAAGDNLASMYGGASSSGTFTTPTGGAGTYALAYHQYMAAVAGLWVIDIKKNGSAISGCYRETTAASVNTLDCSSRVKLAAGDTIEVWVSQIGTVDLVPNTNPVYSYFTMDKVW